MQAGKSNSPHAFRIVDAGQIPYECIPYANTLIRHLRKRDFAEAHDDPTRAAHHNARLQHHHDIFNALLTAVSRAGGRLGLSHHPNENEIGELMVREFRQFNESMTQFLDILKSVVGMLFAHDSGAFVLTLVSGWDTSCTFAPRRR